MQGLGSFWIWLNLGLQKFKHHEPHDPPLELSDWLQCAGESEAKVRQLFEEAQRLAPCIIFIGMPKRDSSCPQAHEYSPAYQVCIPSPASSCQRPLHGAEHEMLHMQSLPQKQRQAGASNAASPGCPCHLLAYTHKAVCLVQPATTLQPFGCHLVAQWTITLTSSQGKGHEQGSFGLNSSGRLQMR